MIIWEERKHRNVCAYTFQVWLSNKNFVVVVASKVRLKRFHCHVLIALTHVYVRQAIFTTLSRFEIVKLRSFAFLRQWEFEYPSTKAANLVVKFALLTLSWQYNSQFHCLEVSFPSWLTLRDGKLLLTLVSAQKSMYSLVSLLFSIYLFLLAITLFIYLFTWQWGTGAIQVSYYEFRTNWWHSVDPAIIFYHTKPCPGESAHNC